MLGPTRRIDRYAVEAPVGEGGVAMVYRVRHTSLGTPFALATRRERARLVAPALGGRPGTSPVIAT